MKMIFGVVANLGGKSPFLLMDVFVISIFRY
jgi:hypothetical protein